MHCLNLFDLNYIFIHNTSSCVILIQSYIGTYRYILNTPRHDCIIFFTVKAYIIFSLLNYLLHHSDTNWKDHKSL